MSAKKRLRPGDVVGIAVAGGTALAQYVGEHPSLGGTLVIDPTIHPEPPDPSKFVGERGFYFFYPARAALEAGLVAWMGATPLAHSIPDRLRRAGARGRNGEVLTWVIVDGSGQRVAESLIPPERRLPIGAIWNHELLVQRIVEAWRPENEG